MHVQLYNDVKDSATKVELLEKQNKNYEIKLSVLKSYIKNQD